MITFKFLLVLLVKAALACALGFGAVFLAL